jgi:hopanoid biosynthesis associated radical SAM protein HpnH
VVAIPGGEPLLLSDIQTIVQELTVRKRFVYLCTNALLVEKRITEFTPSPYLTFNVHLDGLHDRHDSLVCREGVFEKAVAAIQRLRSFGFRVTTNTTFFKGQEPENAARFLTYLTHLGVEGMTVSSAFSYETATEQDLFLTRPDTVTLFRRIFELGKGKNWRFNHSSAYLDFLAGKKVFACTPWGNPTRNIFGWQRPCYLLNDGYAATYKDLMENTEWEKYGVGKDPRCTHCMVHCGFEPTAVIDSIKHPLKAMGVTAS